MKLILAADHRGFQLKEFIKTQYPEAVDAGNFQYDPDDDYVDFATAAIRQIISDYRVILFCGSGHGMDIVANRFPHARAVLGFNEAVAKQGRNDEDANVLILPADWTSETDAQIIINTFLTTPFSNDPRHLRRLEKLAQISP